MWLLYIILAIASSRSVIAFPQDNGGNNAEVQPVSNTFVDGFVFDGPVNGRSTTARTTSASTTASTASTISTTTTATSAIDDCVRVCPKTPEYNPVCGTNDVNYDNPGQLRCAMTCGEQDISIKHYGKCSTRIRAG